MRNATPLTRPEDALSVDRPDPDTPPAPAEEQIRRGAILEAIGQATARLLSSSCAEEVMPPVLELLGRAVGASGVVLDQYLCGSDGETFARPLARWHEPGTHLRGEAAAAEPVSLRRLGLDPWLETLQAGNLIEGHPEDFPGTAGDILQAWEVRAFLAVPIVVENRLTGLLALAECHTPRTWFPLEKDALRVYASIIGSFLHRLEAERELRRSEERYRGLVESQRHVIVRWTPDFRLVFANEAYYRLFGGDRQTHIGRPILDTAPPGASEMIRSTLEVLSAPPFHVAHEQHAVTARGRRWLSWESFPLRDDDGRIVEIQAMGRDVTDERTGAEELVRRDRILAAVNAAAGRFLASSDWEAALADVMEQLGRATGADRLRLWELRTLEDGRRAITHRTSWRAPGDPSAMDPRFDGPFYLDDPRFLHTLDPVVHTHSVNLLTELTAEPYAELLRERGIKSFLGVPILVDGEWWGLMTISQDSESVPWSSHEEEALRTACNILGALIHRQRIKTSLHESEEKYRTLVEGAHQPIIMVGHTGVLHFANRFAAEGLGLPAEQMVGRTMWDLFPHEHAEAHMRAIRRSIDSGRPVISIRRSIARGLLGWFEARIQPLAGSWSGHPAALVIIADITERKQTERRILEYQSRLRSLSSELALVEQRERRRIASELHDRIGQALAMARIKLGGVHRDGSDATLEEVRELIDRSIQDTRTLTFELSPPILYELGLRPALEWLLERLESRHGFHTSFHGDELPVELPPDTLAFIFQSVRELLVNVAKHARARRVSITLDRTDGTLGVEVADDGIGFASPRTPRGGRTLQGFGIFSIRERIEHLGGSLTIDSQPGKGTRARLCVPLRPHRRAGHRKEKR